MESCRFLSGLTPKIVSSVTKQFNPNSQWPYKSDNQEREIKSIYIEFLMIIDTQMPPLIIYN